VAFFDILLKALNVVQVKYPFYIRHSGSMLLPQRATCYADDTHGISPCREATDLSNCISSAFAGMFGIAFHPEKLRAITTAKVPGVMTLYDWNWTPITKAFGDVKAYITSLGVSYNLRGDIAELFNALRDTLEGVAGILSRREASTMARTLSQKMVTTPQFLYPTQFYKLSENQLDALTVLLLNPLRAAKIIGTRLHAEILINPALGGFLIDLNTLVQESKLRLFESSIAEGGDTRRAMECLCLRLHRSTVDHSLVYSDHAIPNPDDFDKEDETKDSSAGYEWWASSMLRLAGKNHTSLMAKSLMAGGHDHIGSWLPDLSLPARRFLAFYDI
jgi:hypothetical protein